MNRPQFIVAQLGARMHYAVPRIIHEAGMLERFFTDISALHNGFPLLDCLPAHFRPQRLNRLMSRRPVGLPHERVRAFPLLGMEYQQRQAAARTADEMTRVFIWMGRKFAESVLKTAGDRWDAAYVFNSAGLGILEACQGSGKFGVMEQCSVPRLKELGWLQAAAVQNPEWGVRLDVSAESQEYAAIEKKEWAVASRIICPSDFVRSALMAEGVEVSKIFVVPYGVDVPVQKSAAGRQKAELKNRPLRVLVAGKVCLQKGSHDVCEAAKLLKGKAQFRMAGSLHGLPEPILNCLKKHVEVLGPVPRPTMPDQYGWADVFLLPSLCEGSATVIYEALAHGLPVICTPNTGSVVRDGMDGFIVPVRDPAAIANRLEQLAADSALLEFLSANARQRADEYTVAAYGRRLMEAIGSKNWNAENRLSAGDGQLFPPAIPELPK